MKPVGILYGFLTWIITITLILMSHNSNPYIFNNFLSIIITVLALILSIIYLKKFNGDYLKEGLIFGLIIFIINIVLDMIFYHAVNLPMGLVEYMLNVGFIYLIYPIITSTIGFLFENIDSILNF